MVSSGEVVVERWPVRSTERVTEQRATAHGTDVADDELSLVRSAAAGDGAAFDALVRLHSTQVARVARRFLRDPAELVELQDVVQETFLRAYQNLHRFRGKSALRTWLIQIALNLCRDRRGGFWKRRVVLGEDRRLIESVPGPDPFSEGALLRQALDRAVSQLPERLRSPFLLHAYEELSGVEVAQVLGLNESTVWTRIYAARKQLRKLLGDVLER